MHTWQGQHLWALAAQSANPYELLPDVAAVRPISRAFFKMLELHQALRSITSINGVAATARRPPGARSCDIAQQVDPGSTQTTAGHPHGPGVQAEVSAPHHQASRTRGGCVDEQADDGKDCLAASAHHVPATCLTTAHLCEGPGGFVEAYQYLLSTGACVKLGDENEPSWRADVAGTGAACTTGATGTSRAGGDLAGTRGNGRVPHLHGVRGAEQEAARKEEDGIRQHSDSSEAWSAGVQGNARHVWFGMTLRSRERGRKREGSSEVGAGERSGGYGRVIREGGSRALGGDDGVREEDAVGKQSIFERRDEVEGDGRGVEIAGEVKEDGCERRMRMRGEREEDEPGGDCEGRLVCEDEARRQVPRLQITRTVDGRVGRNKEDASEGRCVAGGGEDGGEGEGQGNTAGAGAALRGILNEGVRNHRKKRRRRGRGGGGGGKPSVRQKVHVATEGGRVVTSAMSSSGKSSGGGCKSDVADFAFGRLGGRLAGSAAGGTGEGTF